VRRCLALCLLWPLAAAGGQIYSSTVSLDDGRYTLFVDARIDAPLATVTAAITDYDHLSALNPSIRESRVLDTGPAGTRVRNVISACILFLCKHMVQVQDVTQPDSATIDAVMVPALSDFRYGVARWHLTAEAGHTRLYYRQVLEPDFWVPPFIGPWLIHRKLVREVEVTTRYIEQQQVDRGRL